jgi:hypothetical protein
MIATAISVFEKISLVSQTKSLKSLYNVHKVNTMEDFSGAKRFRRFSRFRIVDKCFQNQHEMSTICSRSNER